MNYDIGIIQSVKKTLTWGRFKMTMHRNLTTDNILKVFTISKNTQDIYWRQEK